MIDFVQVATRELKRGVIEIYPKFIMKKSSDLMIRGGDFYAIWVEERGFWSTDEQDVIQLIDAELDAYKNSHSFPADYKVCVKYLWDAGSGSIDIWHKYCQKQLRDNYHQLDEKLVFSNDSTNKKDYASKRLPYPLEKGDYTAWDNLISVLYKPEERRKIEWAIGAIVTGDSKKVQKFLVMYGAAGTGKSTILNVIQQLFDGYYSVFDAKALGSSSNSFALESFRSNPLVAIQHDGDLSRIEDNTRLNSVVSHELMTVNEKFKSNYSSQFKCFLFMGTNKPVKITDARSGLTRRLIDVSPTGEKIKSSEYKKLVKQIEFELGAIAYHCQEVYLENPGAYDNYLPTAMLGASNDFYNFVDEYYLMFSNEDSTTLKSAWELYKNYCDDARVPYPLSQKNFKEELKNYFRDFKERCLLDDGTRVRNYYTGFRADRFISQNDEEPPPETKHIIELNNKKSIFDKECSEFPAQYATKDGTPTMKWEKVTTKLSDLDTSKLHYVKVPENHIVIDFDIPGEDGNKSLEKNIEEASKWPATYAEFSKSGCGVHLHYIYTGDPSKLSRVYSDHIEVKVYNGNSSLRRMLTKCNDLPIAHISSGLPLKGEKKMVNFEAIKSEKGLRKQIKRNLCKEIHPATKPSIDFIFKILEDAYNSGMHYDVTDMRPAILSFAASSTNQSDYCIKLINKMQFKSEDVSEAEKYGQDAPLVFYDTEVYPNLFLVNWKARGKGHKVVRMINPKPAEIEKLVKNKLVGFNCRRYDNHILYARLMGYDNAQLYDLSQRIINKSANAFFSEAYNLSYTDVYDFASAGHKQSLKKFEIELGIHHQEMGLPWDQPVPEDMWIKVAEYCDNDVIATEAVFEYLQSDWTARQILADVAGMTVNDTTNSLTTKIIFGTNRKPQDQFNYRDMGDESQILGKTTVTKDWMIHTNCGDEYTVFDKEGRPIFPGYKFDHGKSTYRGEEVGEGGYVYSEPGMYWNVALLDIASMHPSSIIEEKLFGEAYTARYQEIRDARIAIKHKDFEKARKMLDGKLAKYLTDEDSASALADALKTAINSVYGLTAAKFENPFRDPRNIDNIVAKRGSLFMINLKHEVQARGFTVAHIKTDSIKIPNATPEIIQFVMDYGSVYGYTFEHEATYEKMCLVNDAVYIAKVKEGKHAGEWTATGTQFAVPYVFKTLFSKEDILFEDMCETKSVTSALYLDMNEDLPDVTDVEKGVDKFVKRARDAGIEPDLSGNSGDSELDGMVNKIAEGHNYIFIGKVGNFCPIKPGCGGGELCREAKDKNGNIKYASATGAKGYRWLEAEMVRTLAKEADIDRSYYDELVNSAVEEISKYGDFEMFISNDKQDIPFDPPYVK